MKTTLNIAILLIVFSVNIFAQDFHFTPLEGHTSRITELVFSSDGTILASASEDRTIRLWDVATSTHKHKLTGHNSYIYSIAFSPDGTILASGSNDRTIRLWDATTGFHQQTLTGHTSSIYDISFIQNGQTLASKSNDGTVRLWDGSTGQYKETLNVNNLRNVSINADGTMLAGVYSNRSISLLDIATEIEVASLTGHTSEIYSLTFSPDGKLLASGGYDRTIRLWDLSTHVYIAPSNIESPPVGEQFEISINIAGGQDVRGYKLTVDYDNDALEYVSHANKGYLSEKVFEGPTVSQPGKVSFINISTADAGNGDGALATITFTVISRKASTISLSAMLSNSDGERLPYIAISGKVIEPPWDVNGDGVVDILDLSFVAARFGQEDQTIADVNGDGTVDIKDLITIASGLNTVASAPLQLSNLRGIPTRSTVQQWITQAKQLHLTDAMSHRGIHFLQKLLAFLIPERTALLANYPNPFNPETWVPYHLAKSTEVTLTIYGANGSVVRTLGLGHQAAGIYQDRSRAAYWDGKNEVGESVASGIYFYTLSTGDFTATRKMLILK